MFEKQSDYCEISRLLEPNKRKYKYIMEIERFGLENMKTN